MRRTLLVIMCSLSIFFIGNAQNWEEVKITPTKIADEVYMLQGKGKISAHEYSTE